MKKSAENKILKESSKKEKIEKKIEKPNPISILNEKNMEKTKTFEWNSDLSVNEPTIDKQHKGLFEAFKRLSIEPKIGEEIVMTREALHFIFKYIREHFSYEEEYMKKIKFPDLTNHKKVHEYFIKEFEKYQDDFKKMYSEKENLRAKLKRLNEEIRTFLGNWLTTHIKIVDHQYAEFAGKHADKSEKKEDAKKEKNTGFDLSAIKREIESDLKNGKIKPHEAEILKQRAPMKNVIEILKEKKGEIKGEFIQTGIPGFDELFEDGIPKGSAVLIAGGAGSGKTICCLQMLAYHASKGEKCFYMSFEESEDRLKQHMKSFGWDVDKLIKTGKLKISRTSPFDITRNVDALLAKEKGELLIDIEPVILPANFKPDFVVLDSLTAIASAFTGKEDSYRIYIEQLFRFFEKIGATTFLITETKQIPEIFSTTGVEEFLADGVIVFYNFNRGDIRENAIEILKMRGEKHQKKIVAMTISDSGITVYPEQEVFGFKEGSQAQ